MQHYFVSEIRSLLQYKLVLLDLRHRAVEPASVPSQRSSEGLTRLTQTVPALVNIHNVVLNLTFWRPHLIVSMCLSMSNFLETS